jgi:antitoxin component HigA of HigAB toxin-antitoxin module
MPCAENISAQLAQPGPRTRSSTVTETENTPEPLPLIGSLDDYTAVMDEVAALVKLDPAPSSPEGRRLLALATIVEEYEARAFPAMVPRGAADVGD